MKKVYLPFLGFILLRLLFDYTYDTIISVVFGYYNFNYEPSTFSFIISWAFLLSLSPLIIKTFYRVELSSNIMTMLILVSLLPTTTMIAYNSSYSFTYILLMYIYWLLLLILNLYVPEIVLFRKIKENTSWPLYLYIIISSCAIIYVSWVYTGFRFHFGLLDVYDIRAEAREYQGHVLLGYIITAADNILPVILTYFLIKKQRILAAIIAMFILLNFGISAAKLVVFLLIFAIGGYLFIKSTNVFFYGVWAVIVIVLTSIFEFLVLNTYFISNFSLFRVFFIPAKLHYVYYEFFSKNEFDYFRQSAFKFFLESPYKDNIQFLMGYNDIRDFSARANNGLFSDAYLNFGVIGILLFPIVVVLILKYLEGAAKNLNPKILFITATSVTFVIQGVPFTQALLTSGLFLLIILFYLIPKNQLSNIT